MFTLHTNTMLILHINTMLILHTNTKFTLHTHTMFILHGARHKIHKNLFLVIPNQDYTNGTKIHNLRAT